MFITEKKQVAKYLKPSLDRKMEVNSDLSVLGRVVAVHLRESTMKYSIGLAGEPLVLKASEYAIPSSPFRLKGGCPYIITTPLVCKKEVFISVFPKYQDGGISFVSTLHCFKGEQIRIPCLCLLSQIDIVKDFPMFDLYILEHKDSKEEENKDGSKEKS